MARAEADKSFKNFPSKAKIAPREVMEVVMNSAISGNKFNVGLPPSSKTHSWTQK